MTWPAPITLSGDHVRLEPLDLSHADALKAAAADLGQLWYTSIPTPEGMEAEITRRIGLHDMQPFTVMTPDGTLVGMTTYMNTDEVNRRVEIGSTWISKAVQRTLLNSEAKFLLLRHAFEELGCNAVEFRTHRMNTQSRRAIERLGAQLDGILRAHMVMPNDTLRDTAVYSIIAPEWPTVRAHLLHKLGR
ncbi:MULTISPECIES: GNAT family N-acetyltransferase [unclassified Ruegeria]|uniref:GNAT family N-acetyltransferase n=1 Tax=unclassified Ruegeria TaxID=2625375 RepID=UPI0014885964|nr:MULTISPECIES: GNAT family protein [unclassified Ruegeria]